MNILVLNGSPAGENSITLQTIEYLKIFNPGHTWETLHVGARIRIIEQDFAPSRELLGRVAVVMRVGLTGL